MKVWHGLLVVVVLLGLYALGIRRAEEQRRIQQEELSPKVVIPGETIEAGKFNVFQLDGAGKYWLLEKGNTKIQLEVSYYSTQPGRPEICIWDLGDFYYCEFLEPGETFYLPDARDIFGSVTRESPSPNVNVLKFRTARQPDFTPSFNFSPVGR